jgi:hypothetical protein
MSYAEASAALQPLRTQSRPPADIAKAETDIEKEAMIDIRALQICLFFVVLALLEYFILPSYIVHGAAFLTLCVGVATAIYLTNT